MDWPSELKYRPTENTEKTQAYECYHIAIS